MHANEPCYTYEWVTSRMWMSHVPHVNESCHTYKWVMSHVGLIIHMCGPSRTQQGSLDHTQRDFTCMCDTTHSYIWHDEFIHVTWLIHIRDITRSYMWYDSAYMWFDLISRTHCNTLPHTATHCNTLQHTATQYHTLWHTAPTLSLCLLPPCHQLEPLLHIDKDSVLQCAAVFCSVMVYYSVLQCFAASCSVF